MHFTERPPIFVRFVTDRPSFLTQFVTKKNPTFDVLGGTRTSLSYESAPRRKKNQSFQFNLFVFISHIICYFLLKRDSLKELKQGEKEVLRAAHPCIPFQGEYPPGCVWVCVFRSSKYRGITGKI